MAAEDPSVTRNCHRERNRNKKVVIEILPEAQGEIAPTSPSPSFSLSLAIPLRAILSTDHAPQGRDWAAKVFLKWATCERLSHSWPVPLRPTSTLCARARFFPYCRHSASVKRIRENETESTAMRPMQSTWKATWKIDEARDSIRARMILRQRSSRSFSRTRRFRGHWPNAISRGGCILDTSDPFIYSPRIPEIPSPAKERRQASDLCPPNSRGQARFFVRYYDYSRALLRYALRNARGSSPRIFLAEIPQEWGDGERAAQFTEIKGNSDY
jgi:hypothetical protein